MDELSKYQLLLPLTGEEYDALKTAIGQDGRAHVPIVIDENGEVLDGYHRLKACKELRKPKTNTISGPGVPIGREKSPG